ncbi:MAG TPA: aspartate aminotransferase family protein, partial [Naasia sp.]
SDRRTRDPLGAAELGRLKSGLLERGYLPFTADNRIHVVPPCVVTEDEVEQGLAILDEVLGTV